MKNISAANRSGNKNGVTGQDGRENTEPEKGDSIYET
jgi:hypothetical protein